MRRLAERTTTGVLVFAVYLLFSAFSGRWAVWAPDELLAGALIALLVGWFTGPLVWERGGWRLLQPQRWVLFLLYLVGPFLYAMARANLDVAWRVITGRINPGIVRFNPGLRTDFGRTFLANSITLTPGTLTLDVDDGSGDFFVHWINVTDPSPSADKVCGPFPAWARRVAE